MAKNANGLEDRIAELAAHIDAATHQLLTAIREYDDSGDWHRAGFASCAHWLSWRVGWDMRTAREKLRVARRLVELPRVAEGLRKGELSYSKVRAITRVADQAHEGIWIDYAKLMPAAQLDTLSRKVAAVLASDEPRAQAELAALRSVQRSLMDNGMVKLQAVLSAEEAAVVWAALAALAALQGPAGPSEVRTTEEARADALVAMAESIVRGTAPQRSPIEVIVTVPVGVLDGSAGPHAGTDAGTQSESAAAAAAAEAILVTESAADDAGAAAAAAGAGAEAAAEAGADAGAGAAAAAAAAEADVAAAEADDADAGADAGAAEPRPAFPMLADGTILSSHAIRRLCCDAGLVTAIVDDHGQPLSVGRRTRAIPVAIKRALLLRDRCCQFPGCANTQFVDGHHIKHWADGGATTLANLILLCSRHHRLLHEGGENLRRDDDVVRFYDARGRRIDRVPAAHGSWRTRLGTLALQEANAALHITAATNEPAWDGHRVDYAECAHYLLT